MTEQARSTPAECPAAPMDVAPELHPAEGETAAGMTKATTEAAAGATEKAAPTTDSGEVRDA